MDYPHIFNSDFMISTMINTMSPIDLYHYRHVTKHINNYITINTIYNKIIFDFQNKLKNILEDKYDKFMDMMVKYNIQFYGLCVTESIWNENFDDTNLTIRMGYDTGKINDNVFTDYKQIDNKVIIDPNSIYNFIQSWFMHESDEIIILNNYGETKNKIDIELYIINEKEFHEQDEIFPILFQNNINIVKDNNGNYKWILTVGDIKSVMNKIQQISFTKDTYYYNDYMETYELCNKYNIKINLSKLRDYIIDECEFIIPIIVCDDRNIIIKFTMLGNSFISTKKDNISCDEIEIMNNDKYTNLYINVELRAYDCNRKNCPFFLSKLDHFHSCIFIKNHNDKFVKEAIIFKYYDIPIFSHHTDILNNMNKNMIIDNIMLNKCHSYSFPPRSLWFNINNYIKLFNYNFDEGEYLYVKTEEDIEIELNKLDMW